MEESMSKTSVKSSAETGIAEGSGGGFWHWLGEILAIALLFFEAEESDRSPGEIWKSFVHGCQFVLGLAIVGALVFAGYWEVNNIQDAISSARVAEAAHLTHVTVSSPDENFRVPPAVVYKHTLKPGLAADRYVQFDTGLVFVVADDGDALRLDEYGGPKVVIRSIGTGATVDDDEGQNTLDQLFQGQCGASEAVGSLHVESRITVSTIEMSADREDIYLKDGKKRLAIRDGHARIFDKRGAELPHLEDVSG